MDELSNKTLTPSNPNNPIPATATHRTVELSPEDGLGGAATGRRRVVSLDETVGAGASCLRLPRGYWCHNERGGFLLLGAALARAPGSATTTAVAKAREIATTRITDAAVMEMALHQPPQIRPDASLDGYHANTTGFPFWTFITQDDGEIVLGTDQVGSYGL